MKKNKKKIAIFIIAILLSIIFIILLDSLHYECPWRKIFHIYCPGCGLTRMVKELFQLNIYQAFRYNPLMFILLVVLLPIYIIINVIYYIKNKKLLKVTKTPIIILIIVLLLYFVLRNLPICSYLIPTNV